MTQPPATVAEDEAELRFRLAGVVPPPDRAAGAYANAARMLSILHWLRQERSVGAEPANIFVAREKARP